MKIRIHEMDIDGTPVAYTGEYYVGANATEIVEAMKKNLRSQRHQNRQGRSRQMVPKSG